MSISSIFPNKNVRTAVDVVVIVVAAAITIAAYVYWIKLAATEACIHSL